jgi:DNA mismatch repair protein MSH6
MDVVPSGDPDSTDDRQQTENQGSMGDILQTFRLGSADKGTPRAGPSKAVLKAKQKLKDSSKKPADLSTASDERLLEHYGKHICFWVFPAHVRDAKKRRPADPDYDATTLYVPPCCAKGFTPAQAQYWKIKATNFDVVLFFKVGKFYELFDSDADIGVKELGLNYMASSARPHAGFPEPAYNKYAEQLVRLGFKVQLLIPNT